VNAKGKYVPVVRSLSWVTCTGFRSLKLDSPARERRLTNLRAPTHAAHRRIAVKSSKVTEQDTQNGHTTQDGH